HGRHEATAPTNGGRPSPNRRGSNFGLTERPTALAGRGKRAVMAAGRARSCRRECDSGAEAASLAVGCPVVTRGPVPPREWWEEFRLLHVNYGRQLDAIRALDIPESSTVTRSDRRRRGGHRDRLSHRNVTAQPLRRRTNGCGTTMEVRHDK